MIVASAEAVDIDLTGADLSDLSARLYEIERSLIPHGLHVLGRALHEDGREQLLSAFEEKDRAAVAARLDSCDELAALVHALDGNFVPPAPGGDIARNPDVLPTGRNIHGFDPFRIPSAFAAVEGSRDAARLLARHLESSGALPRAWL
jgi:magnesium chelatase subunit H